MNIIIKEKSLRKFSLRVKKNFTRPGIIKINTAMQGADNIPRMESMFISETARIHNKTKTNVTAKKFITFAFNRSTATPANSSNCVNNPLTASSVPKKLLKSGQRIAISRRIDGRWHLIGYGEILKQE